MQQTASLALGHQERFARLGLRLDLGHFGFFPVVERHYPRNEVFDDRKLPRRMASVVIFANHRST